MSDINQQFENAVRFVTTSTGVKLSQSDQLHFYGLYKVAVDGPCKIPAPSKLKPVQYAKWSAYHKASEREKLTSEQAKKKYVEELTKLVPSWNDVPAKL